MGRPSKSPDEGTDDYCRKYLDKNIHIAFRMMGDSYLYDHDALVHYIEVKAPGVLETKSWRDSDLYSWPHIPDWAYASRACVRDVGTRDHDARSSTGRSAAVRSARPDGPRHPTARSLLAVPGEWDRCSNPAVSCTV